MPAPDYTKKYSCRRKRDYMTFSAVGMFILLIAFQLYLIFIVPMQLKREDALALEVAKEQMLSATDDTRSSVRKSGFRNDYQQGERDLVLGVLDNLAIFIRTNRDCFTLPQAEQLKHVMARYASQCEGWKKNRFSLREEKFSTLPYVKKIAAKTKEHYR